LSEAEIGNLPRSRHIPERTCVACGTKAPKRDLSRIVRTPAGKVVADPTGKAPGRGAYICSALACWDLGLRKGSVGRGLHVSLSAEDKDSLATYAAQHLPTLPTTNSDGVKI
jgi:predicted RNA-binding protein YlxR (DUF448 family)